MRVSPVRLRFAVLALAASLPAGPAAADELPPRPVAIRLASDPHWPPFSFGRDGRLLEGLDVELVRLVEKQLGRPFQRIAVTDWSEALQRAGRREIDVLSGAARTPARAENFDFTEPYLTQQFGIVTRTEAPFLATLASLAGRRVAAVPDHAVTERLRHDVPGAFLVPARHTEHALRLVAAGEADAVLTDLVNANYLIKAHGLANLKISGLAPYRFELRFAVRRDWPELVSELNAAIAALDAAEKQRVVDRWVRVDQSDMANWETVRRVLLTAGGALLAILTAVFWHNHRLREELAERRRVEAALRQTQARLEESNRERAQLLDMAAHDLRNPLTGLLLSLDFVDVDEPEPRRRVVGEMRQLASHLLQLLSDLLDAQSLEEGRRLFRPERIGLDEIVRDAVVEHHRRAVRKMLRLQVRLDDAAPIHADRSAVQQIVDNLLSNAIKFSPVGRAIEVGVTRTAGHVRLEIADEGPGISAEGMTRLFTKYARLNARPTGGETSAGLGLSIARQLVEAMRGRIWCESELGRGARFVVEFPALAPAAVEMAVP